MRCISSEGVDFSQLAQHSSSQPHHHHHHHPDDVTTTTTDVTSSAPRASGKAGIDLKPLSLSDNSSCSSPQLSPMSTTSDCDLTHSDSAVFKDPPRMSSVPSRFVTPQQFSSTSSPDLITLQESSSKRSSSGISSTSSLYVNGDSESDSSRASTAKNTISGSSSLSTLPDELGSAEIRCVSESHLLQKASANVGGGGRKLFERRFRTDEILSDLSTKRPDLSVLQMLKKDAADSESAPSVQLPERYRHALRKSGSYGNVVSVNRKGSGCGEQGGQDLTSREKDLGTALAWIRHEMVQMKEQDKVLLKRFIELRANILHLRCMYGSASDICSMDGSTVSLNEMRKPARLRNADSDVTLSGRLYSASSSLSLPCSPQLSRLRFRSDDFM